MGGEEGVYRASQFYFSLSSSLLVLTAKLKYRRLAPCISQRKVIISSSVPVTKPVTDKREAHDLLVSEQQQKLML